MVWPLPGVLLCLLLVLMGLLLVLLGLLGLTGMPLVPCLPLVLLWSVAIRFLDLQELIQALLQNPHIVTNTSTY